MKLVMLTEEVSKRFGDETAVKLIKEAGFDGYDYSMFEHTDKFLFGDADYVAHAKKVRKAADDFGLPCLQAHAPCRYMRTREQVLSVIPDYLRSIEICAILGCKLLVAHPGSRSTAEENKMYLYDKILPYAEDAGVVIATENLFKRKVETEPETIPAACGTSEDFIKHIDLMNNPYFTGCVDIGHAEMVNCEGAANMIRKLGHDRVGALHVHDNDLFQDSHTTPFSGKINWNEVTQALKGINYKGNFTFENSKFMRGYPDELIPQCLKLIEQTGRYLIGLIEK